VPPQGLEAAAPCQAQSGSAAGNEVGITGARQCAVPLCSARLCAGFTCGNMEMTWWRECGYFPGGQGVAGSNPAVPTGSETFSNIVTPHKSQQKSQLVVQRPFNRRTPIGCHGVLTGACANTLEPTKPHSQGVKDHRAAPNLRGDPANREPAGAIRAHRRHSTGGTRAVQGPQLGLPTPPQTRGGRPGTTAAIFTATWTPAASSLSRKCHLGQQPMRCTDK